ncbi:MAG: spermidine synthase, partial [Actinomycetota bacterium]
ALEPVTYYHRTGPAGQIFDTFGADPSRTRVAVIGLGTGTLACYGTPAQRWTFYEIDPAMERVARDMFSFLDGCGGSERVVIGDARLTLADAPAGSYDLIVVDAFNSDAIPVHLVTSEALDLYVGKLSPDGLLAFHLSNRYLDMNPVLAALADDKNLAAMARSDRDVSSEQGRLGKTASDWVLMSPNSSHLSPLTDDERWSVLRSTPGVRGWTDAYSNVFSVFRWN